MHQQVKNTYNHCVANALLRKGRFVKIRLIVIVGFDGITPNEKSMAKSMNYPFPQGNGPVIFHSRLFNFQNDCRNTTFNFFNPGNPKDRSRDFEI